MGKLLSMSARRPDHSARQDNTRVAVPRPLPAQAQQNMAAQRYLAHTGTLKPSRPEWVRDVQNGLNVVDNAATVAQAGNFIPTPWTQAVGRVGSAVGMGTGLVQAGLDAASGDYEGAARNAVGAGLSAVMGRFGKTVSMPRAKGARVPYINVGKNPHLGAALGAEVWLNQYRHGGAVPVFRRGGTIAVVLGGQSHEQASRLGKGNPIILDGRKVAETESAELLLSKAQTDNLMEIIGDYRKSADPEDLASLGREMKTILDAEVSDNTCSFRTCGTYKPVLKKGGMIQLNGKTGQPEAVLAGNERIFSREDTRRFFSLVDKAGDTGALQALGQAVLKAIETQDSRPPEYTN
jgi:hypothetical protein